MRTRLPLRSQLWCGRRKDFEASCLFNCADRLVAIMTLMLSLVPGGWGTCTPTYMLTPSQKIMRLGGEKGDGGAGVG